MEDRLINLQQLSIRVISSRIWVTTNLKAQLFSDSESVYTKLESRVRLIKLLTDSGVPRKLAVLFKEDALAAGEALRHLFCEKFPLVRREQQKLTKLLSKVNFGPSIQVHLEKPHMGYFLLGVSNLSHHFAFDPSGHLKTEQVIIRILQQKDLQDWERYLLARHYFVFDPNSADSFDDYIEMLKNLLPAKCLDLLGMAFQFSRDLYVAFDLGNFWAVKYYGAALSDPRDLDLDKLAAITRHAHLPDLFHPGLIALFHYALQYHKTLFSHSFLGRYLLDNFRQASLHQTVPFWIYSFRNGLLTELVLQTETDNRLRYDDAVRYIGILVHRIISYNENHLFRHVEAIWERSLDDKEMFVIEHGILTKDELFYYGFNNIEYTTRCLLLLQTENSKFKHNVNIDFIVKCVRHLIKWNESFSILDEYLETFISAKSEIQTLKRKVIDSLDGQCLLRELFSGNSNNNREQGKMLLQWLLETNISDETEEYIKVLTPNDDVELDENIFRWIPASDGVIHQKISVIGGYDINHEIIYVGRANYKGEVIPGKIVPSHGTCYVAKDGKEYSCRCYEVLCTRLNSKLDWLPISNDEIPSSAIKGSSTSTGNVLYIGRVVHQHDTWRSTRVCGKVDPTQRQLLVPFDTVEMTFKQYQVLCLISNNDTFPVVIP